MINIGWYQGKSNEGNTAKSHDQHLKFKSLIILMTMMMMMIVMIVIWKYPKLLGNIYRVIFLTGPTLKSSKYGTGPTQQRKMTKFSGDGKNPY